MITAATNAAAIWTRNLAPHGQTAAVFLGDLQVVIRESDAPKKEDNENAVQT